MDNEKYCDVEHILSKKDMEYNFTIGEHDKGKNYAISRLEVKSEMAFGEWLLIYRGVFYNYKTFDEVSNILNNMALALHNVPVDDDKYFALLIHIESDYVRVASCIMYKIIFDRNSRTYKMCPFSDYNS